MSDFVEQAVADRIAGVEASRRRVLGAAIIIGFGAALLAYRLLRNRSGDDEASEETS